MVYREKKICVRFGITIDLLDCALIEKWSPIPKKIAGYKTKQINNNINVRMDFRIFMQKNIFPND